MANPSITSNTTASSLQGSVGGNNGGRRESEASVSYAMYHFSTSGASVAVATAVTHPLDVIKVRLQMQLVGQRGQLTGMGKLFAKITRTEGARALYLGVAPALTRSILYGGLRLGLYEPCKYVCEVTVGSTNFFVKVASGAFSGAIATALTNPLEVMKVRLQMDSNPSRGTFTEMHKIISEEGIRALWKGVGPAMARAGALTASQLATYDESKQALLKRTALVEGFHLHLISSAIAGAVGTLVTAPMDMIKTRLMLQRESNSIGRYRNVFHCAYEVNATTIKWSTSCHVITGMNMIFEKAEKYDLEVMRTEGFRALYKGGFAIFARLGPQTTITFVVCEKLRELAGMKAM